jgi:3-hydroxybutyryl-CoA dehydrogenase
MVDSKTIAVVGGGTMGSGIALAALLADFPVVLYDVSTEVLARAREYIETHLNRKRRAINIKYLSLTTSLEDLAGAGFVIEAIPEDLSLKQALFTRLDEICPPPAILASNTSTLSVTAIAAATAAPERVAGMHFFNPAPVLPLVEVIRAARCAPETVQALARLAERLGKTPVIAGDTPGFIVNRVARPFYGEALRLLGEGAATHEQIDRLARQGGGFRMGPFELVDLIGIDVNFTATQSVYEQTFSEPRFRPHPIQAQMVAQKAFGRKTGRGFYTYENGQPYPTSDPFPSPRRQPHSPVLLAAGSWAPGMRNLLEEAGVVVLDPAAAEDQGPSAAVITGGRSEGLEALLRSLDLALTPAIPILCQCTDARLAEMAAWVRHPERLVGFDGLFFHHGPVASLVASPVLKDGIQTAVEDLLAGLQKSPVWIADTPGLVLPRLVCTLANEAAFAAGEGVADPETIDRAMQLGTNYPKGPLAWAREIGYGTVVAVLEHLRAEYGEERYRVAPLLRKWARLESISSYRI